MNSVIYKIVLFAIQTKETVKNVNQDMLYGKGKLTLYRIKILFVKLVNTVVSHVIPEKYVLNVLKNSIYMLELAINNLKTVLNGMEQQINVEFVTMVTV